MYVFFFGVVYYFNKTNIDEAITLLDKLFYVNAAVMAIQFFILGYKQDNLGGIFGTLSGCNAYVNLFFCIILCNSLIRFYGKEESQKSIIFKIFLMLVLAAFAELKFFYVEFCILFVAVSLITAFSWKKLVLMLVAATTFFFGVSVFIKVFPNIQLSPAELLAYASSDHGYTSSGDLNRLNFVSPINSEYLNSILKQIFGLGLGNCDYATGIGFLETPFYLQNGWTHYAWMSTTFTYLENGWIGMIFFFGFFVLNAVLAWKKMKADTINKKYYIMAIMASLSAVMNAIYNISLRIEAGYMLYFMLAIPWCLSGSGTMEKQG